MSNTHKSQGIGAQSETNRATHKDQQTDQEKALQKDTIRNVTQLEAVSLFPSIPPTGTTPVVGERMTAASQQQKKVVESKTPGRQHGKYNTHQRLSHSHVTSHQMQQQTRGTPIRNKSNLKVITAGNGTNVEALGSSYQTNPHQVYISRQGQQNQQMLSQSIGEASNGSYVFDGGSNMMNENPNIVRAGIANFHANEGRSLSNESSPDSKFGRRNLIYKNVRNFHNLYENRQLASKNTEMQDSMRLGKPHPWTIRRAERQQFLPLIQSGANQVKPVNCLNASSTEMSQMKRIRRNVMEDGTQKPQIELKQSDLEVSYAEKPGTHHGYQSSHYTGQLASTEPTLNNKQQNMTQNSFNQQEEPEGYWKVHSQKPVQTPFIPELSISSNFYMEQQLVPIKPIMRRNCLVNRSNIVVQWKSFEIYVARLEFEGSSDTKINKLIEKKLLNPVYVPFTELIYLLTLPLMQMEQRIVRSLKLRPKGTQFMYVPQETQTEPFAAEETFSRKNSGSPLIVKSSNLVSSPRSSNNSSEQQLSPTFKKRKQSYGFAESNSEEASPLEQLPEELITSLYMQQANADFQIIIKPPSLEYSIPSKNFLFIKTLTRDENQEFIQSRFLDWHMMAIRCLKSYSKFTELLHLLDNGMSYQKHMERLEAASFQRQKDSVENKKRIQAAAQRREKLSSPTAMQIYQLDMSSNIITDYPSLNEFKRQRYLEPKSGLLRGCFSQNNSLGNIRVPTFELKIKSLDTDYEYNFQFGVARGHWSRLIGYMQAQALQNPYAPKQLVDKICKHFLKSLERAHKFLTPIKFSAAAIFKSPKQQQQHQGKGGSKKTAYSLLIKEEHINEKVNEFAIQACITPSKTVQKLAELRKNGIAAIGEDLQHQQSDNSEKQQISQEQSKDSIEQQRKRFAQDARQALKQFIQLQNRNKMLQVADKSDPTKTTRYLVEIDFPVCHVSFQGQNLMKPLVEDDLTYMVSTQFCRWKNYLMTKHFRMELNIGNEKPLPKIEEDKRGEDDLISETDPRDKFPITEAEKPRLEETRAQVSCWFPV